MNDATTVNDTERQGRAARLTSRQHVFCRLVALGTPIGAAAIQAGYSDPSHGSRLMRDPKVSGLVDEFRTEIANNLAAKVTGVLSEVVDVIASEIQASRDPDYALSAGRTLGLAQYAAAEQRANGDRKASSPETDRELDAVLGQAGAVALDAVADDLRSAGLHDAVAVVEARRAALLRDGLFGERSPQPARPLADDAAPVEVLDDDEVDEHAEAVARWGS